MVVNAKTIHCPKCPKCQKRLIIVKVENGEILGLCQKHGLFDFRNGKVTKAAIA